MLTPLCIDDFAAVHKQQKAPPPFSREWCFHLSVIRLAQRLHEVQALSFDKFRANENPSTKVPGLAVYSQSFFLNK
jgi:hypothetical protein